MTLLEQIIESPRMAEYVRELTEILASEGAAREKFYSEIREDQKAEFINGRMIVHSPARLEHNLASKNLLTLLNAYVTKHSLGIVMVEKALIALTRNDYEPDITFFGTTKAAAFVSGQLKFPAPDLAVEILSESTEKFDRKIKFEDYAAHGVDEYWIVDADERTIEQYLLAGEQFQLAVKVMDGIIHSRAIRGFELSVPAVFDDRQNYRALEAIINA